MNTSATFGNSSPSRASTAAELEAAYHATTYLIRPTSGKLPLRIGEHSPELEKLLAKSNCEQWAFISAANPESKRLSEAANAKRHRQLLALLSELKLPYYTGDGVPDVPNWPIEPGFFICGITLEKALEIGKQLGQVAIVAGKRGTTPQLHYCIERQPAHFPITELMHGY
ncbi:MAG: DUF3293 domain-containing protein [Methylophilales bacterium]|nr:DUF3293 domain-containing protein [Methylophilales bacterium]